MRYGALVLGYLVLVDVLHVDVPLAVAIGAGLIAVMQDLREVFR